MNEINKLLDEIILSMRRKTITIQYLADKMEVSRLTITNTIKGKGKSENLAKILDLCRKYDETTKK